MTDKAVWFVTGAGRGMGAEIVKTAFAAGYAVVANELLAQVRANRPLSSSLAHEDAGR
jgi:NAD(P)-dependent dehydrogenase (short-subunit alcohol dehydrogenase family)